MTIHQHADTLRKAVRIIFADGHKCWAEQEELEVFTAPGWEIMRSSKGFAIAAVQRFEVAYNQAATPSHIGSHNKGASYIQHLPSGHTCWSLTGVRVGSN